MNSFTNMQGIYHLLANAQWDMIINIYFHVNKIYRHIFYSFFRHKNYNFNLHILNKLYFSKSIFMDIDFNNYYQSMKNYPNTQSKIFHHNFCNLKSIFYKRHFFWKIPKGNLKYIYLSEGWNFHYIINIFLYHTIDNFQSMVCIYHFLFKILWDILNNKCYSINKIYRHIFYSFFRHKNYNFNLHILNKLYFS